MSPTPATKFSVVEVEEDIVIYEEDQLKQQHSDSEETPACLHMACPSETLPGETRFAFSPLGLPHRIRGGSFMLLGAPRRLRKPRRSVHLPDAPSTPPSPTVIEAEFQVLLKMQDDQRRSLEDSELIAFKGLTTDFHMERAVSAGGKELRTPLLTRRIMEAREMEARLQRRLSKVSSDLSLPATPHRCAGTHKSWMDL